MRQQSILLGIMVLALFTASVSNANTLLVETNTAGVISTTTLMDFDLKQKSLQEQIRSLEKELQAQVAQVTHKAKKVNSTYKQVYDIVFADVDTTNSSNKFSVNCKKQFTTNMRTRYTGEEVLAVQRFLNTDEDTLVSNDGVGSVGQESNYFGVLSVAAVKKFQQKYAKEVLYNIGLQSPTGYWGPSTRRMANRLAGCME